MESQLQHTQGHHNDEQEIQTSHHDHNENGEKKSMMQKVKGKAKRFRNTIAKHGHQQHDDDGDDDDDNEDETVKGHDAPKYDSDAKLTQPSGNLERPSAIAEDHHTKPVASHDPPLTVPAGADGTNLSGQSGLDGQQHQGYGQEVHPEEKEEVPFAPNPYGTEHPFENRGQDGTHGGSKNSIGKSTGMMMGSGSDPANYETKVTNPTHTDTGGKEAELSQTQHSFDKMGIHDSGSERKRFDPEHPESVRRATLAGNQSTQSSSYKEKISSTASTIAEKAVVAKDVIASKLGYSGEHPTTAESHENVKNSGSTATDYAHKIIDKVTETLAPVYEKVVGSSVMSKVQGTVFGSGSGAGTGHQQMHGTETVKGTDKGVSVKEGDEDKAHAIHRGNQEVSEKKSGEDRPMGRVTESVEVRRRLGTDGFEEQQQQQSGNASANKNVTERSE